MNGKYQKNNLVSIITPTYNSERFIRETIESVRNQSYQDWEMIIVDDCSNDNTCNIIKTFYKEDTRIKLVMLKKNSGAAVARNTAISKAKGRFIAFLDGDDLWDPLKLEKQLDFMVKNNCAFSFTKYRIITESGEKTQRVINIPQEINYKGLLKNTIIGCLTVIIDVSKIGKPQMPNIRAGQDTATWLEILRSGIIAKGFQEELAFYRKVENSISSNKFKALKRTWNIYRNVEKLDLVTSIWCFSNYVWNAIVKNLLVFRR
ncbi:glycosyltransferase family 2 protein [Peribacillus sp. FSL R5-0717]|uniref:glycosyltransferase family 2 protein n=1 Tax=Peribacillus sp. FSL R5-0717 TaxID=2975308 RepID=UPI0030F9D08C